MGALAPGSTARVGRLRGSTLAIAIATWPILRLRVERWLRVAQAKAASCILRVRRVSASRVTRFMVSFVAIVTTVHRAIRAWTVVHAPAGAKRLAIVQTGSRART